MKRVLIEDSKDFFNVRLRKTVLVLVFCWICSTFFLHSGNDVRLENGKLKAYARDSGLQMTLRRKFDVLLLSLHSISGSLLILSVLAQKIVVGKCSGVLF